MYNNSTYKNSYLFNRMLIKVNRNEIYIKQKIGDKNNKNVKNRTRFAKAYNIQNQRNYGMNPTPFKKVLESLH